jgi:ubiquinone/menaquinone biosynthesis C-methylase UbiE
MLARAKEKAGDRRGLRFLLGDAYEPPLTGGAYDVVLSRHVLWAMPDPAAALRKWLRLLASGGTLLLVEGRWSNDVGLAADEVVAMVESTGRPAELTRLADPVYWGRVTHDDRYVVTSIVRSTS